MVYRKLKNIDIKQFQKDVEALFLKQDASSTNRDIDDLVQQYNQKLLTVIDEHAPMKKRDVIIRTDEKWYTEEIRSAKQRRRQLERLWRTTKLEVHKLMYKAQCNIVSALIRTAKKGYYVSLIHENENDTKALFKVVNSLLGKTRQTSYPSGSSPKEVTENLATYFQDKIKKIRINIKSCDAGELELVQEIANPSASKWTFFDHIEQDEVKKIIKMSPNKSCALDSIPTELVKACIDAITPAMTEIVNTSLQSGIFPEVAKRALITPLLKKPSLDAEVYSNYRPVSNLSLLSKVLEKVVAVRMKA